MDDILQVSNNREDIAPIAPTVDDNLNTKNVQVLDMSKNLDVENPCDQETGEKAFVMKNVIEYRAEELATCPVSSQTLNPLPNSDQTNTTYIKDNTTVDLATSHPFWGCLH